MTIIALDKNTMMYFSLHSMKENIYENQDKYDEIMKTLI